MKTITEEAAKNGTWVTFAGHDIGPEARQVTIEGELEKFCQFITDPANGVWVATIQEIAEYVKQHRK